MRGPQPPPTTPDEAAHREDDSNTRWTAERQHLRLIRERRWVAARSPRAAPDGASCVSSPAVAGREAGRKTRRGDETYPPEHTALCCGHQKHEVVRERRQHWLTTLFRFGRSGSASQGLTSGLKLTSGVGLAGGTNTASATTATASVGELQRLEWRLEWSGTGVEPALLDVPAPPPSFESSDRSLRAQGSPRTMS